MEEVGVAAGTLFMDVEVITINTNYGCSFHFAIRTGVPGLRLTQSALLLGDGPQCQRLPLPQKI